MQFQKNKHFLLLLSILFSTIWCDASVIESNDGYSHIIIKETTVQGAPRGSSIEASINGHVLIVAFTENLGQVNIEVSAVSGGETQVESTPTPNGVLFYIYDTGSYIVTFTLPNGDEYYGEFEVTN